MSAEFDPYREWLGVKSAQRPPNYYQLLDLNLYESNRERIENAEMMQMAKVLRHESGPQAELAARLGRELEAAVCCLLDPADKAAYDAELFMAPREPAEPPKAAAAPPAASYNFNADLKLDEEEQPAEARDDFSDDLKLSDEEPQVDDEPEPATVARSPASPSDGEEDQEDETIKRPSLMDMLEKPAKGKDPAKGKEAAATKKAAHSSYDPPPIPKKSLLPAMPQLAVAPGKLIAVAAVLLVILAAWFLPGLLPPSKPDSAKILAKIEAADPQTRIDGIDHLHMLEIDANQSTAVLVKVLKEDQTDSVRLAAVNALINNGTPSSQVAAELKPLIEKEPHASVKAMLQWLIEQSGTR